MYDVIVIGLGGHGSAALYHLTIKGQKVLGIEAFSQQHDKGSSHGETRMIRYSYANGGHFVPLLMRARELWRDLEERSCQELLREVGAIYLGPKGERNIVTAAQVASDYGLDCEFLNAAQLYQKFPQFNVPSNAEILFDKEAGYLRPEKCINAHLSLAEKKGAETIFNTPVLGIEATCDGVKVQTEHGVYEANKVVVTVGAYLKMFPQTAYPALDICRLVVGWFEPDSLEQFSAQNFPPFLIYEEDKHAYGLPVVGCPGVKIGASSVRSGGYASPQDISRDVSVADETGLRYWLDKYIPSANGARIKMSTCLAMDTPDDNFILGPHPEYPDIILGHACSGHGFKMSTVIGEILASYAVEERQKLDLSAHDPRRFSVS